MADVQNTTVSGLGAMMAGGNPNPARGRAKDDFYPTPVEVTRALVKRWPIPTQTVLWEPCAGNGVMVDALRAGPMYKGWTATVRIIGTDINPQRADILKMDVFDTSVSERFRHAIRAVVTNPPYTLAPQIIEHVLGSGLYPHVRFFALVLKASFWHAKRRHALFLKHRPAYIHPLLWRPDFQSLGRPTMEAMWCVWLNPSEPRVDTLYEPLEEPK